MVWLLAWVEPPPADSIDSAEDDSVAWTEDCLNQAGSAFDPFYANSDVVFSGLPRAVNDR